MEPEAFLGTYNKMVVKMAEFQKKREFSAKVIELFALSAVITMK